MKYLLFIFNLFKYSIKYICLSWNSFKELMTHCRSTVLESLCMCIQLWISSGEKPLKKGFGNHPKYSKLIQDTKCKDMLLKHYNRLWWNGRTK